MSCPWPLILLQCNLKDHHHIFHPPPSHFYKFWYMIIRLLHRFGLSSLGKKKHLLCYEFPAFSFISDFQSLLRSQFLHVFLPLPTALFHFPTSAERSAKINKHSFFSYMGLKITVTWTTFLISTLRHTLFLFSHTPPFLYNCCFFPHFSNFEGFLT